MMPSSCARAATAKEARFRIDYPNSKPRVTKIIALDRESERELQALQHGNWHGARFLTFAGASRLGEGLEQRTIGAKLRDAAGREVDIVAEVESADSVIMMVGAGSSASAAEVIGNVCLARGVMTTGLVIAGSDRAAEVSRTLRNLRPFAAMLVVSSGTEYVAEMLTALRA
jgi:hypothetical protein